jgi:antirestriction protein ArdC
MAKFDAYEAITAQIIAKLEAGVRPWRADWNTSDTTAAGAGFMPPLPRRVTGEHYRGINVLLLWITAQERGYRADTWMTFNQAKELGASCPQGRKGHRDRVLQIADRHEGKRRNGPGRGTPGAMRAHLYRVQRRPDRWAARPLLPGRAGADRADHQRQRARPGRRNRAAQLRRDHQRRRRPRVLRARPDTVQMPDFDRFETAGGYLATLAHELCHWTGHKSRLARNFTGQFGSKDYAAEELVAEIGAAFIGAQLGILGDHIDNHAAYIGSWLQACATTSAQFSRPPASPRPPPISCWPTPSSNAPPAPPDPQPTAGAQVPSARRPSRMRGRTRPRRAARQAARLASRPCLAGLLCHPLRHGLAPAQLGQLISSIR